MPRSALLLIALVLVLFHSTNNRSTAADDHPKPNILFIFADDQAFDTLHSLGNDEIETPNLDRLAARGVTFTHAYNQGSWSGAVCVASRAMLNTGRFLWHANKIHKTCEKERAAGRFWSEYLKKAGYETYMTGKWHVPAKAQAAFNHTGHVRGGMPNQTPQGYNRPHEGKPDLWSPYDTNFGGFWAGGKHWSEVVGDDAEGFFNHATNSDKPFFMYLAFNAPHDPRQSPKEFVDKYPLERISMPKNYLPMYPFKDAIGCSPGLRDEKLAPFPRTEYAVKVNRQEYYAIITHMDVQIGRILDALKKSGKSDNTYIFFTADHGLAVGHHGLMGKQNLFDHSVRVPFMVAGPGIPKDKRLDGAVYLQDVMATSLDLADIKKPDHVQFKSVLPVIQGKRGANYDALYGAYLGVQRSVRMNGYKLIMYPKINKALLFNLQADPHEMHDLAGDAASGPIMKKLYARFVELQKEVGDTMKLSEVYPKLAGS